MLAAAEKEQLTYQGFLAELLLAECDDPDRRRSIRRVKAAGFPREKWLGDFEFEANPNIKPATIHSRGDRVKRVVFGVDEDLHRSPVVRRNRGPAHLRWPHHRDRDRLLPSRAHPRKPWLTWAGNR